MRWPCRFCLVRPSCSEDCQPYKRYMDQNTQIYSSLSIIIGGGLLASFILYITEFYPDKEAGKNILWVVWLTSIAFNVAFFRYIKEEAGPFITIIFAPFMAIVTIFLFIFAKIVPKK